MPRDAIKHREAIDVLAQRLPLRALETVRQEGRYSREILDLYGIGDHTITDLLLLGDTDIRQIVRSEVDTILQATSDIEGDVFSIVDAVMRNDGNPLLAPVRLLVQKLIES